ncbi:MAG: 5-bromo-4-chloroindolyl phosphate hydrolysis protein, partial [Gallicola sp.]|nr:5-bromo-4-chloroindolyl phosphate hydrolysis protein [Gallicola sp.]
VDYYLPTTVKLLESYIELQNNSHISSELEDAKREINLSFNSINTAYTQILTKLFEDKRLDIMTETSVLDSVLKMDGLSEEQP